MSSSSTLLRQGYREIADKRNEDLARIDRERAEVERKLVRLRRVLENEAEPPRSIAVWMREHEARLAELEPEWVAVEAFALPEEPSEEEIEAALTDHKRIMREGPREAARENIRRQFESVKLLPGGRLEVIGAEDAITRGLEQTLSTGVGSGGGI